MNTNYVLLSSVKNEEAHIAHVLASVVRQLPEPLAWFIVDDGSTDGTVRVIKQFAEQFPFIRFSAKKPTQQRNWASKDQNLNDLFARAVREIQTPFAFVAVLDGDQAPASEEYFARLLSIAISDPAIGVLGGVVHEWQRNEWKPRPSNSRDSVPGSALFRRDFFDRCHGYVPLEYGGSDALIQTDAIRMGYKVHVEPSLVLHHYRKTNSTTIAGSWKAGLMDASLGGDPFFQLFKCARRMLHPPFIGGFLRLLGFASYAITRAPQVEPERAQALRKIQRAKLFGS